MAGTRFSGTVSPFREAGFTLKWFAKKDDGLGGSMSAIPFSQIL
jgi:hypothetical protein